MLLHSAIPNRRNLGSLIETVLPWLGLLVPVVAVLLPAAAWLHLFGGLVLGRGTAGGDFTVATHNVAALNPDPVGTARKLAASGADRRCQREYGRPFPLAPHLGDALHPGRGGRRLRLQRP